MIKIDDKTLELTHEEQKEILNTWEEEKEHRESLKRNILEIRNDCDTVLNAIERNVSTEEMISLVWFLVESIREFC